ncbi:MAG: hypothetical protein RLZZ15_1984 [Verrucomicrobiota bacterium]|jgi:soluble cytochrome b562
MKIRIPLCILSLALALPLGLRAADDKDEQTELGAKMEKMGGAFRRLRNSVKDAAKNADSLKEVAVIKENAAAAAKMEPALKAKKPAGEQAKFVADYQARMKDLLGKIGKVEAALKAGDNATAEKLVAELGDDQKSGHNDFKAAKKKKS